MLGRMRAGVFRLLGGERRRIAAVERWLADNPDKTTGDYYAAQSAERIRNRDWHRTLGSNVSDQAIRRSKEIFESFKGFGIEPNESVIDYGCGTLRIGRWFVAYLEPGNYYGLDVRQDILDIGIEMLEQDLRDRHPRLFVITDETLSELAKLRTRWIVCNAVINHIPPSEYELFFRRLRTLMDNPECRLILRTRFSRRTRRVGATGWYVGVEDVQEVIKPLGLAMPVGENVRLSGRHKQFVIRHSGN